jgi:hypothetical protein
MQEVLQKVGDSLSWALTLKDDLTGVPINLTGSTVSAQLRGLNGELLATPVLVILDQGTSPGQFTLTVADGNIFRTAPKSLFCDIQFVTGGLTESSEMFKVKLLPDITV